MSLEPNEPNPDSDDQPAGREAGGSAAIGAILCPKCKAPIRRTTRYTQQLNTNQNAIDQVKTQMRGGGLQVLQEKLLKLHKKIHAAAVKSIDFHDMEDRPFPLLGTLDHKVESFDGKQITVDKLQMWKNLLSIFVKMHELKCIEGPSHTAKVASVRTLLNTGSPLIRANISAVMLRFTNGILNPTAPGHTFFTTALDRLIKWVSRIELKMSTLMVQQLALEVERLALLAKFGKWIDGLVSKSTDVREADALQKVFAIFFGKQPIEGAVDESLKAAINHCITSNDGVSLTYKEKIQIVTAMRMSSGHWYKCPNGHVYCITECGMAMESSVCPECKSVIGGASHRLDATNRTADDLMAVAGADDRSRPYAEFYMH